MGLPGESREDVINTAKYISRQNLWGVKIHNLHIVEGTKLAEDYRRGDINVLSLNEFASLAADFIEYLPENMIIHRVNAHAPKGLTIAPDWSINKLGIMNAVINEFKKRGTRQGVKCIS